MIPKHRQKTTRQNEEDEAFCGRQLNGAYKNGKGMWFQFCEGRSEGKVLEGIGRIVVTPRRSHLGMCVCVCPAIGEEMFL